MEFNTQVCTTKEQSERLLALGLKMETADCTLFKGTSMKVWAEIATPYEVYQSFSDCYLPAWSLHRLIAMLPSDVGELWWILNPHNVSIEEKEGNADFVPHHGNIYQGLISCIEWLIEENHFNKQYLNKNL